MMVLYIHSAYSHCVLVWQRGFIVDRDLVNGG